ncbi:MAG: hypothetical protein ABUL60_19805 [Myxococcales bacterium]
MSLLLLSSTSGCSFIFVRTPPNDGRIATRVRSGDCTSSKLAPGFDTAFGALELVRTGMAASASNSVYDRPDAPLSREADIALGASFTALFLGSAIYGFINTSRCSRLQQGDEQDQEDASAPPSRWGTATPRATPVAEPPPAAAAPPAPASNKPPPLEPSLEQPSEEEPPPTPADGVP